MAQEEERLSEEADAARQKKQLPAGNYRDKYRHLIGDDTVSKDDAKSTATNRSYGFGQFYFCTVSVSQYFILCLFASRWY